MPWEGPWLSSPCLSLPQLDTGLQVQLEDILLKEHILEQQAAVACSAPKEAALRLPARRRLLEAELPEYILDFGCVGLGGIHRRSVKVTSLGHFPVSFQVPGQLLCGTGFSVELERVEQLPCSQSRSFTVCLEPQSARLPLGQAALLLPIQVTGGPTVRLLLRARGVVPSLCLSRARLEFSPLQCGQCQEETTRLYNQLPVPCQWFLSREEPAQKKLYRSTLKIHICHSSQHLQLLVSGSGLEPRLEFQPEVLELGPVLPSSPGAQGTVVVKNPCSFPIEFYSLEYDLQYLAEEQILRALEGFDCRSTLLLPPRAPGEQLPPELLQLSRGQKRLQDQQAKAKPEQPTAQDEAEHQQSTTGTREASEEPQASPVHRVLALGSAASAEGAAAPQGRGIVVIVHGAPLAGKTSAAAALAKHYGAACLSLDAVVSEAVAAGSSAAGRRARELCSAGSQQSPQQPQDGRSPGWRRYSKARLSRSLSQPSSGDRGSQHSLSSPGQARAGAGQRKMSVVRQLAAESSGSQGSSGSPLVSAPPAQLRLSPRGSGVAELGLGSCVLPQELLVAILSERLQLRDCCQGVVFDGLQSLCAGSTLSALLCLLQAVGNRPHIYFVNLLQDYGSWQARQAAAEERAGREQEAAARREEALLWELGEEEFAALPQQQQAQLESRIRQLQRQRKQRLQLAREQQEQQQRCKEAEELEQQGKGRGKRSLVRQELSVWAYPTAVGLVEDSLICRIKDNPEPVVFQLCCQGVQVKLEVSPRQLHFARVLLHREQSRMLLLRNSCPLPVAWRLSGLESLGQSFWVSQSQGTVGPRSELAVQLCFRASKPLSVEKKIRLEVSDAENVQGVVQVENIQVLAEAYEVALNITLPEGAEGCLDFGVLNVLGSAKQVLTLRNQGQCKLAYRFRLRPAGPSTQDLASHFTVQPQQGLLPLSERPVAVQLLFHPQRELSIEDKAVLLCQVLEPSLRAGGEPMASIPVRLSARAVLSQYSISPAALLDCGAMASGTRRACSFLLHNTGLLPFQFLICRAEQGAAEPTEQGKSSQAQRRQSLEGTSAAARLSCRQAGLTLGMFTVSPAFGCILAGEQQLVRVDCAAGPPGPCQEQLLIDISHRDPRDNPLGIPYTLLAESCLPAFVVDDIEAIFEGHQICSSSNLCPGLQRGQEQQGVFLTDQRKFLFPDVLVGQRATARFSICNRNRVPCDVLLSIKASPRKLKSRPGQVFQVDPAQLCVPSCSQAFATVTFSPQKVQRYQCTFEACLDAQRSPAAGRAQSLSFEVSGEGKVPEVRVLRPARRDRRGNPLLLFRKLPLGAWEKLPLVLQNSGPVPAQVLLDLLDEEGAFSLKARPSTKCLYQAVGMEDSAGEERKLHTASLLLQCGQAAELEVLFRASLPQRLEGKLQLAVLDNPAGASTIRLLGAGCQEDFSLDNIQGLVADREEENPPESSLEEDSLEAAPGHHIQFGACALGTPCSVTFSLTNRSREQALRFQWLPEAPFHFCPQLPRSYWGATREQ
ncbi:hydrocephalus-inducing protein homolog [Melanerpes formicivorus]|uniref:hydrocephalus-inducing protein homolog n=1 Tax=Melanerpes formicivorus TaxID=211600 RepID=UPI00358E362F